MAGERFSIAQVVPYVWERPHEVNTYVERLSGELLARGHRVVVVAPSDSRELNRRSRALVARCAQDPEAPFDPDGGVAVLGAGAVLPVSSSRRAVRGLPIDASHTVQDLMDHARFDFVHVHEPFAPSAASAALRHSRALNVGSFHAATERVFSAQVARRLVALLFGRLDGRTASFGVTRELMEGFFPGDYRLILPGADLVEPVAREEGGAVEIACSAVEERSALRLFLRALRRLPPELPWRATVWLPARGAEAVIPLGRRLSDRVRFTGPWEATEAEVLARADVCVMASSGIAPSSTLPLRAMAAGAVPVAARIGQYEEALLEGERGLLFEPRDAVTLAAQLERLVSSAELRGRFSTRIAADRPALGWSRMADEFEELFARIAARRIDPDRDLPVRRRLRSRAFIHVDLHMHTDHSPDCATPVLVLLETARANGLDAIAVTDHNEISGALEARRQADGIKVIVAEEVKTRDQGEVIGLFLEEKIPRGLGLRETIAEIRRQGGLVYVPHPFDRLHSVPDYEHLLAVVEEIDAIEVFNPRVAIAAFNEEAARFAAKYRIAAGAGSDSHVAQGLGSVKIRMRDFDGPEEFLASLRDADIIRRRQSLLYVQALKFLQTSTKSRAQQPSGNN